MILGVSWSACETELLRIAEHRRAADPENSPADETLVALALVDEAGLTSAGESYHFARFVLQDATEQARVLGDVLKGIPEVNALCEALWGRGNVPVTGAMSLVRRTMKVTDEHVAKRWLELLGRAGLLTYNRNLPTLRAAYNPSALGLPSEGVPEAAKGHVLSPDTPFSNLMALRDLLRAATGTIRWYEAHFDAKVLEVIAREVDNGSVSGVSAIRLMSGPSNVTQDLKSEFKRFGKQMRTTRDIAVEWRVLSKADARSLHGRFLLADDLARNLPPLNLILAGTLDEILPSEVRSPAFDKWWAKAIDLAAFPVSN